ncbi:heme o synthase [Flavobacteriales bacterium]|nr:heme o synthase [Flavobacteriales bacterium]
MIHTLKYYAQLLKFRLSFTVVFSAVSGYLIGIEDFSVNEFFLLMLGGFLVTGSANGFNQILERNFDQLMPRTANRPLPMKRLTVLQAFIFSALTGAVGLYLLNFIHPQGSFFGHLSKSSFFGLLSILLYVLAYTPMKRISTFSVFIGAIPGAIPFLLGWVAATDNFELIGGTLFAIQFLWQFPHFIAIAWVLDKEYKNAGFKMLFGGKKGTYPALIAIITSIGMVMLSVVPFFWNVSGLNLSVYSFILILGLGCWFVYKTIQLYQNTSDAQAKELMIASIIYLPIFQIIYIIDRFIN